MGYLKIIPKLSAIRPQFRRIFFSILVMHFWLQLKDLDSVILGSCTSFYSDNQIIQSVRRCGVTSNLGRGGGRTITNVVATITDVVTTIRTLLPKKGAVIHIKLSYLLPKGLGNISTVIQALGAPCSNYSSYGWAGVTG